MMERERKSHFEVHMLVEERWILDGLFFAREEAVEDARLLLGSRNPLEAVRVLQVEQDAAGFVEWTIFVASRPHPAGRPQHIEASWLIERAALARPAPVRSARPPAPRQLVSQPLLLATALALLALMIVGSYHPPAKDEVWLFDRPEAWQPHQVRSPWGTN